MEDDIFAYLDSHYCSVQSDGWRLSGQRSGVSRVVSPDLARNVSFQVTRSGILRSYKPNTLSNGQVHHKD